MKKQSPFLTVPNPSALPSYTAFLGIIAKLPRFSQKFSFWLKSKVALHITFVDTVWQSQNATSSVKKKQDSSYKC